jgi:hypothetical protein
VFCLSYEAFLNIFVPFNFYINSFMVLRTYKEGIYSEFCANRVDSNVCLQPHPSPAFWDPNHKWINQSGILSNHDTVSHLEEDTEGQFDFLELYHHLKKKSSSHSNTVVEKLVDIGGRQDADLHVSKRHKVTSNVLNWAGLVVPGEFIGGGGYGDVYHLNWVGLSASESSHIPHLVIKKFKVSQSQVVDKKLQKMVTPPFTIVFYYLTITR